MVRGGIRCHFNMIFVVMCRSFMTILTTLFKPEVDLTLLLLKCVFVLRMGLSHINDGLNTIFVLKDIVVFFLHLNENYCFKFHNITCKPAFCMQTE